METNNQNNLGETNAHGKYTKAYVDILNTYKNQIEKSVTKKNELKTKFFCLIRVIMLALSFLFVISIVGSFWTFNKMIESNYQSVSVIVGAVTGMITTLSTMIISIFKLPKIVAKYLFNKKEDDQMIEIIKNIQTYELEAVKLEKLEILNQEEEIANNDATDEFLEESTNISNVQPENSSDVIEQPMNSTQTAESGTC